MRYKSQDVGGNERVQRDNFVDETITGGSVLSVKEDLLHYNWWASITPKKKIKPTGQDLNEEDPAVMRSQKLARRGLNRVCLGLCSSQDEPLGLVFQRWKKRKK